MQFGYVALAHELKKTVKRSGEGTGQKKLVVKLVPSHISQEENVPSHVNHKFSKIMSVLRLSDHIAGRDIRNVVVVKEKKVANRNIHQWIIELPTNLSRELRSKKAIILGLVAGSRANLAFRICK